MPGRCPGGDVYSMVDIKIGSSRENLGYGGVCWLETRKRVCLRFILAAGWGSWSTFISSVTSHWWSVLNTLLHVCATCLCYIHLSCFIFRYQQEIKFKCLDSTELMWLEPESPDFCLSYLSSTFVPTPFSAVRSLSTCLSGRLLVTSASPC